MITKENKINLFLLLIYAIYLNPIIVGGYQTLCYALVYGSALLYVVFNFGRIRGYLTEMPLKTALPFFWILLALALAFVVPAFHNTNDYSYVNVVLAIFRKALILVFLFTVTSHRVNRGTLIENFMLYYSLASVLYILGTIAFALLPSLRSVWQGIIRMNELSRSLLTSYGYSNRFGWAGFAGFRNTIDCTTSLIFIIYLYASRESKLKLKTPAFIVLLLICFLGNMFYGRTGVIASGICVLMGLVLYRKIRPKVVLGVLGLGIIGALAINFLRARIPSINEWYIWISTPFYNLFTTGSFNNYSANRLLNEMIFMPEWKTLMLGDGIYISQSTGSYYMRTDSGFMRQILFWGVWLTGIMYFFWLETLTIMKRDLPLKLMLLIMCILFEIKGEVYYEMIPLFMIIAIIDYKSSVNRNIGMEYIDI